MAEYFDKFPVVPYGIDYSSQRAKSIDLPVNIMVRVGVLIEKLNSVFHYYDYTVREGETPEIIADKFYGSPEAHWLILLTNNIIDPQYDWVMHYKVFANYITNKYGNIATAKTQVHHYELIYKTQDVTSGKINYDKLEITQEKYESLVDGGTPVVEPLVPVAYNVNGKVVNIFPEYVQIVYAYDWEVEQNENKRDIKLIKREYYNNIVTEFDKIMKDASPNSKRYGIRSLT